MAWDDETGKQPTEAEEFDRVFALDDPDADDATQQTSAQQTPPAQAAGDAGQQDTGGQAAPGDGGDSGGTATEQPGATGTTTQQSDDDWLASADLPQDVKDRIRADREARDKAVKEANDRYKALEGRVAPVQRRLSDAQRRLAQLEHRTTQAQPAAPAAATQPASQQNADDSYFDSPEFKKYEQMFPDDAKVLREVITAQARASQEKLQSLEATVNQIAKRLESTEQVASRTTIEGEIAKLEAAHPDWNELNQSDEFWGWFDEWRSKQPKSLRGMYYDEAQLTELWNDSEFAIGMINIYKAQLAPANTAPQQTTATTQTNSTAQQPAAPAQQQTNARLAMSTQPQVRGTGGMPQTKSLDGLTEAEQFEELWKQVD